MDEPSVSPLLQKFGHGVDGAYTTATLIVGGMYQDWALAVVNWSTLPWIVTLLFVVFVPLGTVLRLKSSTYLSPVVDGLGRFGDGVANIVIGGVGVAWFNLALAMGPFYMEEPRVILPVVIYFLLIPNVFLLKRTIRRASKLVLPRKQVDRTRKSSKERAGVLA